MFYSEKFKLLIIGIPKTGTVSIQEALTQQLDKDGECHSITWKGKKYYGDMFPQGHVNHARAWEIKSVLGQEIYSQLTTIAFIRNPYAKLVSAYHFTKSNPLFFMHAGKRKWLKRTVFYSLGVFTAKFLPFGIWIMIYPYRSSSSYILDDSGYQIVNYVGATENLEEGINTFLSKAKIIGKKQKINLPRKNTSKHIDFRKYYKSKWVKKIADWKMGKDIQDYEERFEKCL